MVQEGSRAVGVVVREPVLEPRALPAGHRVVAQDRTTQVARRQLMRSVVADLPQQRNGEDRAARREALLHSLEMSRRLRRAGRR